jgi:uncharacterized protein (TIGR04255 family)
MQLIAKRVARLFKFLTNVSIHQTEMAKQDSRLASFKNAPVRETVLGVQFDEIPRLTSAHLGIYWRSLGTEWSTIEEAMPIEPVREVVDESLAETIAQQARLQLVEHPRVRLRITNPSQYRMIQVQSNRFHCNWLGKSDPNQPYPRYRELKPEFIGAFDGFCKYVDSASMGPVSPNQWEITYVNYIPRGTVWETPDDWNNVFRAPLLPPDRLQSGEFESIACTWHYRLPNRAGRLHIGIKHGFERVDSAAKNRELLILTLTARGPTAARDSGWTDGLDVGRYAIVKAFEEMTSPHAHDYWGKYYE